MATLKLKPCPFCGNPEPTVSAQVYRKPNGRYGRPGSYEISCHVCGTTRRPQSARSAAYRAWNRRAPIGGS